MTHSSQDNGAQTNPPESCSPQLRLSTWLLSNKWALLGLGFVLLVMFRDALLGGQVFFDRDIHLYAYPTAEAVARAMAQGSWPTWNPYLGFGEPLWASPDSEILYPLAWLNLVLSPWRQYTIFVLFHCALLSAGIYALARRLGMGKTAAFFAAALALLSGPSLSLVNLFHHFAGAAWLPWIYWAMEGLLRRVSLASGLTLAALLALQITAGSADMCVFAGLILSARLAIALLRQPRDRMAHHRLRLLGWVLFAAAWALALAAAQWLPSLEVARRSMRQNLPSEMRTYWSMHPASLAEIVWPVMLRELPLDPEQRLAVSGGRDPFLASLYLGAPAIGLALIGLLLSRRPQRFFIGGVLLIGLIFALGRHTPLHGLFGFLFPPLRFLRYPVKAMVVVGMASALMSGFGIDALAQAVRDPTRRALARLALFFIAISVFLGCLAAGPMSKAISGCFFGEQADAAFIGLILVPTLKRFCVAAIAISSLIFILDKNPSARRPALGAALAGLLAVGELLYAHDRLNPTCRPEQFQLRPAILSSLPTSRDWRVYVYDYSIHQKSLEHLGRLGYGLRPGVPPTACINALSLRLGLYPSTLALWNIEGSWDLDLKRLRSSAYGILARHLRDVEGTPKLRRLLAIGAVKYVVALHRKGFEELRLVRSVPSLTPEPLLIFEVPDPRPRAYVVQGVRVVAGQQALEALVDEGFDYQHDVMLEEGREIRAERDFSGHARITAWRPDRIDLRVDLNRDGHLVLVDAFDPGWRVSVDGDARPVKRANAIFRAVELRAGHHQVSFVYRPWAVFTGLGVTLAALLATIAMCLRSASRARSA